MQYIKSNFTGKSIKDIIESVKKSASNYTNPIDPLGYGIPDFQKASTIITAVDKLNESSLRNYKIIYNKETKSIQIYNLQNTNYKFVQIQLINQTGQMIDYKYITNQPALFQTDKISAGVYFLRIIRDENTETHKILID
jgi:hypothetical protein